jgi:hypothetical protein
MNPNDWHQASDIADHLNTTVASVNNSAHYYETGTTAARPIVRKKLAGPKRGADHLYRIDDEAQWRGEHLDQIQRHPDWSATDIAKELGVTPQVVSKCIRKNRWIAQPLQPTVAELYEQVPTCDERAWYAVCDVVLDRLVVSSVHDDLTVAKRQLHSYRPKGACRGVIKRGSGERPEVGLRVRREDLEAVEVSS